MSKKAEWTEEELLEMLVETRKKKLERLQKEEAEAKEKNRVPLAASLASSSAVSLKTPSMEENVLPATTGLKRKREDVQAESRKDASFKMVKGRNEVKKIEALPAEMMEEERSKRTPYPKKERSAKTEKFYKEEKEVYDDDEEVVLRGARTSFEVYHEYFGEELVCDDSHNSLEKQGNCTVIKDASALLLKKCPPLSGVFGMGEMLCE
jgi:hypothetical protein